MEGYSEFWETIIEGKRNDFDMVKLEEEICHSAKELTTKGNLDALILECTDLSAFSRQIQDAPPGCRYTISIPSLSMSIIRCAEKITFDNIVYLLVNTENTPDLPASAK